MEFKFKKGFMPKYYKEVEYNQFKSNIKKYICFLFIVNMIIAPMTINKTNKMEDINNQKIKETVIINKPLINKNIKSTSIENLINITSTMKENLIEIKYENEKIFFKGKFNSQTEGENLINSIRTSIKKGFNYSSKLENEVYIFNVSEE